MVCLGLSTDEAQDAVQDTFLSLHRRLATGGSRENIRSWVFRVGHNRARNRQSSYDRRFTEPHLRERSRRLQRDALPGIPW
jgi:DNA-directed RNA polymerase specialized sigma24 family protein